MNISYNDAHSTERYKNDGERIRDIIEHKKLILLDHVVSILFFYSLY